MKYSPQEVIQFINEEDVKFIRLAFCNHAGVQKNISVMPVELERAFTTGIPINDGALHPDPSTLAMYPWRPDHGRVARMYCSLTDENGAPLADDHRHELKELLSGKPDTKVTISCDFYLFVINEFGDPTDTPYDEAGYLDIAPLDKCENVRRSICLTLEAMGITAMSSCHSFGPGQNRITFCSPDIFTSADNLSTFFTVVRTMAAGNGLFADFDFSPLDDSPESELCISFCDGDGDGEKSLKFPPCVNPYLAHIAVISGESTC